jgi:hypothetical protein
MPWPKAMGAIKEGRRAYKQRESARKPNRDCGNCYNFKMCNKVRKIMTWNDGSDCKRALWVK